MSEKISAMPAATTVDNANDYLPLVQGGVNKKVNRSTLLGGGGVHLVTGGLAPTANYLAPDGGSVFFVGGTDSAGVIVIDTGTGFGSPTLTVECIFHLAWNSAPNVIVQAANFPTATIPVAVLTAAGKLQIEMNSASPGTRYAWYWIAVGAPD